MLNKNDPLIGAVQQVMQKSEAEREATRIVNERFGIQDRKALPHERQGQWDAAYKQVLSESADLARETPPYNKVTKKDVLFRRGVLKKHPSKPGKHVLATEGSDETSPSSMGIKKPDYATGTPDYAKPKTQTVNRGAKTSLPAGTMKEEQLDEKKMSDAQMKKREEIVKSMKKGMLGFKKRYGERAKDVMYATATKQAMSEELEAIQEEIAYNLAEQAAYILDNQGEEALLEFYISLTDEQREIAEGWMDSLAAGARGAWNSATLGGGKFVRAGADYLAKNAAAKLGYGKGTTFSKELDQEREKDTSAQTKNPTAYNVGSYGADAAMLATGVGGLARLGAKGALKMGMKSAEKMATKSPSMVSRAVDKTAVTGLKAGVAGHAGGALAGKHKGMRELDENILKNVIKGGAKLLGYGDDAAKAATSAAPKVKPSAATAGTMAAQAQKLAQAGKQAQAARVGTNTAAATQKANALDKVKNVGQAALTKVKNNKVNTALGVGAAAGLTAAALGSNDDKASSEPPKYTGDVKYTQGSADSQRAMSTTGQAAKAAVPVPKVKPAKTGTKASGSKTTVKAKSSATKAAAQPKEKYSAFQRREARQRVLSGKEGVGPEANRLRKISGVKLGVTVRQPARKSLKEQIQNIIAEKAMGALVAQKQKEQQGGISGPASRLGRVAQRPITGGGSGMPTSGVASTTFTPAGSMNPLDRRTDMQRATQNAGASAIERMKRSDRPSGPVSTAQGAADATRRNAAKDVPQNVGMKGSPLDQTSGAYQAGRTYRQTVGRAEAQKRRETNQPVLQAKDVPGLNKDPKAVAAAQQGSNNIMNNAKRQELNKTLADKQRARAGVGNDRRKTASDFNIGNPMGDYNPGQENSTPTSPKSQAQLNTSPTVKTRPNLPTALKPATVMSKSPSFEFSDKQRAAAKSGKASAADVQAWAKSRGMNPNDKGLLRNYLNAAQNKTMKTGAGAVKATATQTAAQSAEMKMKAGQAQRGRPAGVRE